MRVASIPTNETCNHRCRFCDARRDHERHAVAGDVRRRIDEATAAGATEVRLTGGEPTLRADLPGIVAYARQRGAQRIILETNATRIDQALATTLRRAGLDVARVHHPATTAPDAAAITGDPDAAPARERGVTALRAAGIECEAATPIVADNANARLADLPGHLVDTHARWWLRPVWRAPDGACPSVKAAVATIEAATAAARDVGLSVHLDPATWLPPCAFDRPARVAQLYALNPGAATRPGHHRPPACAGCRVEDRCPGVPDDLPAFDGFEPRPLHEDRLRRRLTVIRSIPDQIERELVTHEITRRPDGAAIASSIVRVRFACNQSCRFCFVSTHLPAPERAAVDAAIDDIAARGGICVLSGGEPTLDPALLDHVRRAKRGGAREVELQTNATRLGEPGRAAALADAGVDTAFVSLHGATAATSDAVTDAPDTFVRTCEGLDALHATAIRVRINFVLCAINHREFPAFVDLVGQRWPDASITVSFVGMSTDLVPRSPDLVPRYTDVLPDLAEGLRRAHARGTHVDGFDSMCGVPACLVPADISHFFSLSAVPDGYDGGEFVHPEPCRRCALADRCFGLRRGYAQMYGHDELRPVAGPP